MLNMKVLDYRISSDSNQLIVNKVRRGDDNEVKMTVDLTGQPVESQRLVGYYRNLSSALIGIQKDYILSEGTEIKTLLDYKNSLNKITEQMKSELGIEEEF